MIALLLLVGTVAVALALLAALGVRRRRRHRERAEAELRDAARAHARDLHRRAVEHDLAAACAHATSVEEVVELLHDALVSLDAKRPHELHLVDRDEPVLRLVFATGATPGRAPEDVSPWRSTAIALGETLVYETTDVDDCCAHLRSRLVEHCSAVAVPLIAADQMLGVLYATGPDGVAPTTATVATYEQLARTTAGAVAALHAIAERAATSADDGPDDAHDATAPAADEADDDLVDLTTQLRLHDGTPLAGRAQADVVIADLVAAGTGFSLLLFDIDGFGAYHARYGARTGDDALRTIAAAASEALGGHGLFRLDGDHLLVVLADAGAHQALRLVDELRGEISRAVRAENLPALTVSFGVVEAARGTTPGRVLDAAHDALYNARARGDASTVIGADVPVAR